MMAPTRKPTEAAPRTHRSVVAGRLTVRRRSSAFSASSRVSASPRRFRSASSVDHASSGTKYPPLFAAETLSPPAPPVAARLKPDKIEAEDYERPLKENESYRGDNSKCDRLASVSQFIAHRSFS